MNKGKTKLSTILRKIFQSRLKVEEILLLPILLRLLLRTVDTFYDHLMSSTAGPWENPGE